MNNDIHFFKNKLDLLMTSRVDSTGVFAQSIKAGIKVSYIISKNIITARKPHNIAEQLILPCFKELIIHLFGKSELCKLKYLSLSNNKVKRRVNEMSQNILSQVILEIKNSCFGFFAIQLDESTDIANLAQLCVYVRYAYNLRMKKEFL